MRRWIWLAGLILGLLAPQAVLALPGGTDTFLADSFFDVFVGDPSINALGTGQASGFVTVNRLSSLSIGTEDVIDTEIIALSLAGTITFPGGTFPITIGLDPGPPFSGGQIRDNNTAPDVQFPAQGFFDVFVNINVGGLTLFNDPDPLPLDGTVSGVPLNNGDVYVLLRINAPVALHLPGELAPAAEIQAFTLVSSTGAPIPEPGTLILLGSGLAGVGALRRLRRVVS